MKRLHSRAFAIVGAPIVAVSMSFAAHLVREQTVWSWARGPQMVGFSLMHSSFGLLSLLVLYGGIVWAAVALFAAAMTRGFGGKPLVGLLALYGLSWVAIATPYDFWQRLFIDRFPPEHAVEFLASARQSRNVATGDPRTSGLWGIRPI